MRLTDILYIDLVMLGSPLLSNEREQDEFRSAMGVSEMNILNVGQVSSGGEHETHVQSTIYVEKDRISITSSQERASISRAYPSVSHLEEDLERMARIYKLAVQKSDSARRNPTAYGYNLRAVFDPELEEPAIKYISRQYLNPTVARHYVGGACRLYILEESRRWTLEVRPHPDHDLVTPLVYTQVNLHYNSSRLPNAGQVKTTLAEMSDYTQKIMSNPHGQS